MVIGVDEKYRIENNESSVIIVDIEHPCLWVFSQYNGTMDELSSMPPT
jgi:hypothetical protein